MANVTFSGNVSSQTGETVTVIVTKPDSSTETLTTVTLADKTFTVTKTYSVAGAYSAKAHLDASMIYQAWDSNVVSFTISLATRAGTLIVTID